MSRSMPLLTDDVFPPSDDEVTVVGRKRISHYDGADRGIEKKESKRLHSPVSGDMSKLTVEVSEKKRIVKADKRSHSTASRDNDSKVPKKQSPAPHSSKKKSSSTIKPITPIKVTMNDLFGDDSEGEESEPTANSTSTTPSPPPLQSVFINKVATGLSKQILPDKEGTHYVEIKVYRTSDIENVIPINRWRHSVSCLKMKTNTDTDFWQHLANVVSAARKEFRGVPNSYTSNFSMQP